jgi:hypothetical protein
MAFVAAATGVGAAVLGTGAAAGIGSTLVGGALIGAGIGGLYSGITGDGNILNSMLTGGLIGGAAGGIGGALFPGAAGYAPAAGLTPAAAASAPSTLAAPTANVMTATPAMQAAQTSAANTFAYTPAGEMVSAAYPSSVTGAVNAAGSVVPSPSGIGALANTAKTAAGLTGKEMLGYGLAGTAAMQLLGGGKGAQAPESATYPGDIRPYQFSARPVSDTGDSVYPTTQYDMAGNPILDTAERKYFDQSFTPLQSYRAGTANPNPVMAAQGGLMAAYPMEKYADTIPNREAYGIGMAQGGGIMAAGGQTSSLGSYSDGGRMLKGPGDGMSDNIPGIIGGKQPARLADGEFVVPADVVSHLGNGSTDAGAKRLYAMMDTVRKARTGNKKQGKQIKAEKYLPA